MATNMVVANMIGTGIFTSLGFQVLPAPVGIPDAFSIVLIWIIGGVLALCGAASYAEVATTLKESGGEYQFLSRIYHPFLGFISGWVSIIVGFSAAISALSIAAVNYSLPVITRIYGVHPGESVSRLVSIGFIVLVALIQIGGVRRGGTFQNWITLFKIAMIGLILFLPVIYIVQNGWSSQVHMTPTASSTGTILSLPFAGALVYVMFSYSGWNASSYIAGEMENPQKNLPFSLIAGTLAVAFIYVLMNVVFMHLMSFNELSGQLALGNLAVAKVFGNTAAEIFGFFFSFSLMSGISAMFIAGPRVAAQMGKDYPVFSALTFKNKGGAPVNAILLQALISAFLVWFYDFQTILQYIEITLSLFCLLTVAGVYVLRSRNLSNENTVKTWGYPFTPALFIGITLWMMTFFILQEPARLIGTAVTLVSGLALYIIFRKK